MQAVPIQPVPSQIVKTVLDAQNFQIAIYQKNDGIFVDINVDGTEIVAAVIARDAVGLACRQYAGIEGNLLFIDTQGSLDPEYSGLGTRWQLVYLTADENALVRQ